MEQKSVEYWDEVQEIGKKILGSKDSSNQSVYCYASDLSDKYGVGWQECYKDCLEYCNANRIRTGEHWLVKLILVFWGIAGVLTVIAMHLYLWSCVIAFVYYLFGVRYDGWNYLVPYTVMIDDYTNIAFPSVVAITLSTAAIVLSKLDGRIGKAVVVADVVLLYVLMWSVPVYMAFDMAGVTLSGWGYLTIPGIVIIVHLLLFTWIKFRPPEPPPENPLAAPKVTALWTISRVPYTPARQYKLSCETTDPWVLEWKKKFGRQAEILSVDTTWIIEKGGTILKKSVSDETGPGETAARINDSLLGDTKLLFGDGMAYKLKCGCYWDIRWELVDGEGKKAVQYSPAPGFEGWHPAVMDVELYDGTEKSVDAPLIVLLGWYAMHLSPDILAPRE